MVKSSKVIVWIHGGGWNAGTPVYFDYVGQCVAKEGYRFVSIGYRLSPKHNFPAQIQDVCVGYRKALTFLDNKGIDTKQMIVSGPSAGAHLASLLCYDAKLQEEMKIETANIAGFIGVGCLRTIFGIHNPM